MNAFAIWTFKTSCLPLQYPFLSILALSEMGPDVKNQQPTIFSWVFNTGLLEISNNKTALITPVQEIHKT